MVEHLVTVLRETTNELAGMAGQNPYDQGHRFGIHRAGEPVLESLRVFGIPPSRVGADKLEPDRPLADGATRASTTTDPSY